MTPQMGVVTDADLAAAIAAHAALADLHNPTREIFTFPVYMTESSHYGARIDGPGDIGVARLLIPQDFVTLTSIEVIFQPLATVANMFATIQTRYGKVGEAFGIHTENAADRSIGAAVNNQVQAHSISDLVDVAALAAGDYLNAWVSYSAVVTATNLFFCGVRLKYSAS